jgi:ATP/maltotriose-dependent transcriptional regulator MalT
LRTAGRLAELRMEELALDADEAAQVLQLHGAPTDARASPP